MHLINHMDGKPYHCTVCGKSFSKSKHLVIHMKNHSWNKCDTSTSSNIEFTCLNQLRMQLITQMDSKPYHCTICRNNFSNSKHLLTDLKNNSWNKCDTCTSSNFEFTCLTQLRMHLTTHLNDKPYHCTICGKSFSTSKHLVIHMKNHSWNKCDICTPGNFELTCLTQLIMHLINHMDGKPYHCTVCGKSFSKSKHLVIHMKITLGINVIPACLATLSSLVRSS